MEKPPDFEDCNFSDHVFKLKKVLYSLKQATRAWYERLLKFLIENNFSKEKIDTTLLIKHVEQDLLLVQIYVDDIIFGSTNDSLCESFFSRMQQEFEMSLMGELNFFLGLHIKQEKDGTFINQEKFARELVKKNSRWKTQRRCLF